MRSAVPCGSALDPPAGHDVSTEHSGKTGHRVQITQREHGIIVAASLADVERIQPQRRTERELVGEQWRVTER